MTASGPVTRRHLLTGAAWVGLAMAVPAGIAGAATFPADRAAAIVRRIRVPRIPPRVLAVADFGGSGDGVTDDSAAIGRAIAACAQAGGGRILLPPGTCLSGPIRLRSNMELHVPAGCRLKFLADPARYLPVVATRWEGVELMGYHPLIYAHGEHDIAVTGGGIIDGSADDETWWPWKGPWAGRYGDTVVAERQVGDRTRLFEMAEKGVPPEQRVFGAGSRLRPPLFQPYRCRNVLVEGVTITNSPFWLLHPVECESVTFRSVTCSSHGPNNDGIDPESCVDVLIDGCTFDTGDDCIAIKAGRNADGRRIGKPCENIVIRNCHMKDGHGGIAIGSEMTGGVRNVFVQDCVMDSPHLIWALTIKTNAYRGGRAEDIHLDRIKVGTVDKTFVQIWLFYEEGEGGAFVPSVERVTVSNSTVASTGRVLLVRGRKDSPVRGLVLDKVTVVREKTPSVVIDAVNVGLRDVTLAGKPWRTADLASLPGLDSITCDKWAVCR
ncbi:glycoside hydrolase family 28 protein [Niveispirillum sp. KHB5.9]|uniref:glycoside hydrolase family 28 protein n=1 Tax=Niveispirillum sp. KHB5.9 TaxID=3400269 RepID=UPI003A87300A